MSLPPISKKNPGRLNAGKEPTTGPPIRYGFNPANVTHYQYDKATGDLIVGFTSGEWFRYVGTRAREVFEALIEDHWRGSGVTADLATLNASWLASYPNQPRGNWI